MRRGFIVVAPKIVRFSISPEVPVIPSFLPTVVSVPLTAQSF
jgi:hypothetical protein